MTAETVQPPGVGLTSFPHVSTPATTTVHRFGRITSQTTVPVVRRTWTWAEAIHVATREAEGRATIRREGGRWVVRWHATPTLLNGQSGECACFRTWMSVLPPPPCPVHGRPLTPGGTL